MARTRHHEDATSFDMIEVKLEPPEVPVVVDGEVEVLDVKYSVPDRPVRLSRNNAPLYKCASSKSPFKTKKKKTVRTPSRSHVVVGLQGGTSTKRLSFRRQMIISAFLNASIATPGNFGIAGGDDWMKELLRALSPAPSGRNASTITLSDVTRWLNRGYFSQIMRKIEEQQQQATPVPVDFPTEAIFPNEVGEYYCVNSLQTSSSAINGIPGTVILTKNPALRIFGSLRNNFNTFVCMN